MQDPNDVVMCFKIKITTEFQKVFSQLEKKYNAGPGRFAILASTPALWSVGLIQGFVRLLYDGQFILPRNTPTPKSMGWEAGKTFELDIRFETVRTCCGTGALLGALSQTTNSQVGGRCTDGASQEDVSTRR